MNNKILIINTIMNIREKIDTLGELRASEEYKKAKKLMIDVKKMEQDIIDYLWDEGRDEGLSSEGDKYKVRLILEEENRILNIEFETMKFCENSIYGCTYKDISEDYDHTCPFNSIVEKYKLLQKHKTELLESIESSKLIVSDILQSSE